MSAYVIRCAGGPPGLPAVLVPVGSYLWAYNPDAPGGRGAAAWTRNPTEALRFPDQQAAFNTWRQVSTTHPVRPDGKPNRPLTCYSVSIEPLPCPEDGHLAVMTSPYGCAECSRPDYAHEGIDLERSTYGHGRLP